MNLTDQEIIQRLRDAGGRDESILTATGSPLRVFLQEFINDVKDKLLKSMEGYDISASNNLKQSVLPTNINLKGDVLSIGVEADFYWKYVNYGVNGWRTSQGAPAWGNTGGTKEQFKESIGSWIRDNGMTLSSWNSKGSSSIKTYDQLENTLMYLIARDGQKARPFFTDVVNEQLINELQGDLSVLLEKIIEIKIIEPTWQ